MVIELKAGKFEPGHVSQLNFYLNVVDDLLRHPNDKPSIGLLLVKDKDQMVVEYSLAGYSKLIGVAQWERQITQSLPDNLKSSLPTVEEIEAELAISDECWRVAGMQVWRYCKNSKQVHSEVSCIQPYFVIEKRNWQKQT